MRLAETAEMISSGNKKLYAKMVELELQHHTEAKKICQPSTD
jgi:hypothetical protein